VEVLNQKNSVVYSVLMLQETSGIFFIFCSFQKTQTNCSVALAAEVLCYWGEIGWGSTIRHRAGRTYFERSGFYSSNL